MDKSGKCLTDEKEILSRWTEYCSEPNNYECYDDNTVLECSQHPEAVAAPNKAKSTGVDYIPAEFIQAGGESMIDVLTRICNKIWKQENGRPHELSR